MNRKTVIIAVILLASFSVSLGFNIWRENKNTSRRDEPSNSEQNPTAITVTGTIVCLDPKDNTGAQDLSCAVGIKEDEGKSYALYSPQNMGIIAALSGKKLTVEGTLQKNQTKYQSEGTITVISVRR